MQCNCLVNDANLMKSQGQELDCRNVSCHKDRFEKKMMTNCSWTLNSSSRLSAVSDSTTSNVCFMCSKIKGLKYAEMKKTRQKRKKNEISRDRKRNTDMIKKHMKTNGTAKNGICQG